MERFVTDKNFTDRTILLLSISTLGGLPPPAFLLSVHMIFPPGGQPPSLTARNGAPASSGAASEAALRRSRSSRARSATGMQQDGAASRVGDPTPPPLPVPTEEPTATRTCGDGRSVKRHV